MALTHDDYTIGWIAALPHELAPARALLDEQHKGLEGLMGDNNTYTLGRMGRHNIVIAALPMGVMGTNAAANAAKDLIRSFKNVRFGLMVGIGGGVPTGPEDVRLGDIVVSTRQGRSGGVVQYDFGTKLQDGAGESLQDNFVIKNFLRDPPTALQTAVTNIKAKSLVDGYEYRDIHEKMLADKPRMKQKFKKPLNDTLYKPEYVHRTGEDCSSCDVFQAVKRQDRDEPLVHYGLIGSGNQVVRDAILRDKLYQQEKIICFEMEAAGLMKEFECMVIRGICDYCDSHKNKDWQFYAAAIAAAYAKELLLALPARQVEAMPKSKMLDTINNDLKKITAQNTEILAGQQSSKLRDALNWIAAPDPETNFQLAKQRKDPDTGMWITESKSYTQWKADNTRHIWLHGKAGCGKSVLTATAIPDIQKHCANINAGFAMFYFSFSDNGKQSWENCLRSLVVQLGIQEPASTMLIQAYQVSSSSPSGDFLRRVLLTAIKAHSKVFIVLDALDESPTDVHGDDTVRGLLLDSLVSLSVDAPNIKFFLTSRDEVDIRRSMETMKVSSISMITECVDRDIKTYVTSQLAKDKRLSGLKIEVKNNIQTTLMAKADGMFRWAYCQLHQIKNLPMRRPKDIERALAELPKTLDETYERMLQNINQISQEETTTLLRWLAYAERPLLLEEIAETITISLDRDGGTINSNNRPEPKDVVNLLGGLVIVRCGRRHEVTREWTVSDNGKGTYNEGKLRDEETTDYYDLVSNLQAEEFGNISIQLAHFSVKEYLESSRSTSLPFHLIVDHDQHFLSNCCLVYLMHYAHSQEMKGTKEDLATFPFLHYAARFWFRHYTGTGDIQYTISFLNSRTAVNCWAKIFDVSMPWRKPFAARRENFLPDGLQVASYLGLYSVAEALIKLGANVNADGSGPTYPFGTPTALGIACQCGHTQLVEMLIASGADVNANENNSEHYERTALYNASYRGDVQILRMLVDAGVNTSIERIGYKKSIAVAAQWCSEQAVKFLIDAAVGLNVQRGDLNEALAIVLAGTGSSHIVRMLIEGYGVDPNQKSDNYGNALQAAAANRNSDVHTINMLIEDYGMDVNSISQDTNYSTALQAASGKGCVKNVRVLIEASVNVNVQGGRYGNALQAACLRRDKSIVPVELLLQAGANIDAHGGEWGTALGAAVAHQAKDTVAMLLEAGADANISNSDGRAPIHHAASRGNEAIFSQLFLTEKCDLSVRDRIGRPVLDYICMGGSLQILETYLKRTQYDSTKNGSSSTWSPMHWACRTSSMAFLQLLNDAGVQAWDVETKRPAAKWTPLDIAVYFNNYDILLVESDSAKVGNESLTSQGEFTRLDVISERSALCRQRENKFKPASKTLGRYCDGCLQDIYGLRFMCKVCKDFDYCFMCKHDSESIHPDHEWECINPDEDDEATDLESSSSAG